MITLSFLNNLNWPRRYNYWSGDSWLTGKSLVDKGDVVKLIRGGEIVGVWQCFGDYSDPCRLRDLLTFEFDVNECEDNPTLDCVVNWASGNMDILGHILKIPGPLIYYNGGKSLYIFIFLTYPVPSSYVLRGEWRALLDMLRVDNSVLLANHAVRVPGTPHPRTGNRGVALGPDLKPINNVAIGRVDPSLFLTPPPAASVKPIRRRVRVGGSGRELPAWVRQLIDYLKSTGELCHYARLAVAAWMLANGYGEDEVVEVFKHARNFNEKITRYHINYVWNYLEGDGRPIRCVTVVEMCGGHKIPSNLDCGDAS
ncbi:MAG: hypothetical protein ACP5NQ_05100 [Vulcanisaeta sp.]